MSEVEQVRERLAALLPELEYGRETHVQWRDCDQSHRDRNPEIGDSVSHDRAVAYYDERIAAIKQASDVLATLAHTLAEARAAKEAAEQRAAELAGLLAEARR